MGQVTLGIRSLMVKVMIFIIMAALLAWALGGTLLPRLESGRYSDTVQFDGRIPAWELSVGGRDEMIRWRLMSYHEEKPVVLDERPWADVAGPMMIDGALVYGGHLRETGSERWLIVHQRPGEPASEYPVLDRLGLEQQLARMQRDLPVQSLETMRNQRDQVIDPEGTSIADSG